MRRTPADEAGLPALGSRADRSQRGCPRAAAEPFQHTRNHPGNIDTHLCPPVLTEWAGPLRAVRDLRAGKDLTRRRPSLMVDQASTNPNA
ncbi:hypothetical protein GCM10028790_18680 [Micromonospora taraxaci]